MKQQIKNVVLVHGAFADGSGWEAVAKILKNDGYKVSRGAASRDLVRRGPKVHEGRDRCHGRARGLWSATAMAGPS